MFLQVLGNDFVFLLQPVFQPFDCDEVGILLAFVIARVGVAIEVGGTVCKELFLPVVEADDTQDVLVANQRRCLTGQ